MMFSTLLTDVSVSYTRASTEAEYSLNSQAEKWLDQPETWKQKFSFLYKRTSLFDASILPRAFVDHKSEGGLHQRGLHEALWGCRSFVCHIVNISHNIVLFVHPPSTSSSSSWGISGSVVQGSNVKAVFRLFKIIIISMISKSSNTTV